MKHKHSFLTAVSLVFSLCIQAHAAGAENATERIEDPVEDIEANFSDIIKTLPGGAVYNTVDGSVSIKGNFTNIEGTEYGGAIYNSGTLNSITGSFSNNFARILRAPSGKDIYGGGAIFNSGKIADISDSVFEGNYTTSKDALTEEGEHQGGDASGYGGAIFNDGLLGVADESGEITGGIINSTFRNNYAAERGGAIFNSENGTIGVISGTFEDNYIGNSSRGSVGGAIYNAGSIGAIDGNFTGNHVKNPGVSANGGAISNVGTIHSISGVFEGNYVETDVDAGGGAISNKDAILFSTDNRVYGEIGDISGSFQNNRAISGKNSAYGGAIYHMSDCKLGNITANFDSNYAESSLGAEPSSGSVYGAQGGAIYCDTMGDIVGNFTNNYAKSSNNASGGAIYGRSGKIGSAADNIGIKGNFRGNYAQAQFGQAQGGAIYTNGSIANISGNFSGNYALSVGNNALGGAICGNGNVIGDIIGDFSDNYASTEEGRARGGAVYLYCSVGNITGNYTGNYARTVKDGAQGGAIFNIMGTGNISGNFSDNYAESSDSVAQGGAIYNYSWGDIRDISGNFSGNHAKSACSTALGGAICNMGKMGSIINSSFTDNYAQGDQHSLGGAIYTIQDLTITADASKDKVGNGGEALFSGNWAGSETNKQAIYIDKTNATLTLQALNKGKITFDDKIECVSDYTLRLIGDDIGSIITLNNYIGDVTATLQNVTLKIGNVSDMFKNSTLAVESGFVDTIDEQFCTYLFKELTSAAEARYQIDVALSKGMPCNDQFDVTDTTSSGIITLSSFVMNEFEEVGDEASSDQTYIFQIIKGAKDGNVQLAMADELKPIAQETAHMTSDDILADGIELHTTDSLNDSLKVIGWRDNLAAWAELQVGEGESKSFTINEGKIQALTRDVKTLEGRDLTIKGLSGNTLNLHEYNLLDEIAEGQTVTLSYLNLINPSKKGVKNEGVLNIDSVGMAMKVENNNLLKITGTTEITNTITSSNPQGNRMVINNTSEVSATSVVNIQADISNQNIVHEGNSSPAGNDFGVITNLNATDEQGNKTAAFDGFRNNSLAMKGGLFHLGDMRAWRMELRDFNVDGGAVYVQKSTIDLTTETMGGIDAQSSSYNAATGGYIWLEDFTIAGFAKQDVVHVKFVDENMAYAVKDGKGVANGAEKSGSTIIKDEELMYDWEVTYNDPRAPQLGMYTLSAKDFTYEVQVAPVTYVTGSYVSMMQVYNYAFEHADLYSASLPSERKGRADHCAVHNVKEATDAVKGSSACSAAAAGMARGLWLQTYASHENMPLRNGPKVSVDMYGGIVGGDSSLYEHRGGWASVYSLYGGYLGSTQKYGSVRIRQNGAAAGATATFYKENFHMAFTATLGTSSANATDLGGRESFDMLMGGVAARAGYNIGFGNGGYVLQPQLMVSYTCFNVSDYTNASGVKIDAKPTNVLQFHPSLKFVKNTNCMWNPYISAGFVYDCFSNAKFRANGLELPNMSVKPYAEYSIGVQRTYRDRDTLYGQITGRQGGRQGAEASIGIRRVW